MDDYSKLRKKEFSMKKSSSINTLDSSNFDEYSIQNNSTPMSTSDSHKIRKNTFLSGLKSKQQTVPNTNRQPDAEQYFLFNYKLLKHVESFEKLAWNSGEIKPEKRRDKHLNQFDRNEFFRKVLT